MDYKSFVETSFLELDARLVDEMRSIIIGEYITFAVMKDEEISQRIFAEKMCDYFEKLELKTGKSFEKHIQKFIADIESLVGQKIPKEEKKKGQTEPIVYRSTKYFDKALKIKIQRQITMKNLLDFYRIMMCLYSAEIKSEEKDIRDFDLSMESIYIEDILEAMKTESAVGALKGKKPRFDTKELYCQDTCTFILVVCLYYYMKSYDMLGE